MAHYDVYSDLGINPSLESPEIVEILDERIASTSPGNVADLDRLKTSRQLFSNESRRREYDRALNDPSSPEISISKFREFARGRDTATASGSHAVAASRQWDAQSAPTQRPAPASTSIDLRFLAVSPDRQRSESLMWLIGFGIIVLGWLYLLFTLLSATRQLDSSDSIFAGFGVIDVAMTTSVFAVLHTIAMLTVLQFLWNLRMFAGRFVR